MANLFTPSVAPGTFGVQWNGLIVGMEMPDPAARNWLSGGWLAAAETLPMWGGLAISENVPTPPGSPATTPQQELGGPVIRATQIAAGAGTVTGISVFTQDYSMVLDSSDGSEVPKAGNYNQVNFYRLGTNARIAVAMAPSLSSLQGGPINAQVSWDFTLQMLVPYAPAYGQATISGATWASTGGGQVNFTVNVDYQALLSAGSIIQVANVVNTGGVSTSAFNGQWTVVSVPDATHVIVSVPASGSIGTYASGGIVRAGGGAFPCRVLKEEIGNSMVPVYNTTTGALTWNRSGNAALILI